MKGDGNCGWRGTCGPVNCPEALRSIIAAHSGQFQALAFGFFEVLLRTGDRSIFKQESARLKTYNTLLNSVGYDQDLYIDFVQETLDLLEQTAATVASPDGEPKLLASFNDEGISNSIITHFRVRIARFSTWVRHRLTRLGQAHHQRVDEVQRCHVRTLPAQRNH